MKHMECMKDECCKARTRVGELESQLSGVEDLERMNEDGYERDIRALQARVAKLEAVLVRIRDQEPHDTPWINPRIIASEVLGSPSVGEHAAEMCPETAPPLEGQIIGTAKFDCVIMRLAEAQALRRILESARAIDEVLTKEAREYQADIYNDEHEQLRSALHNLDSLGVMLTGSVES